MDSQVRNVRKIIVIAATLIYQNHQTSNNLFFFQFRDFLQLYNKLTELCFQHCADNFFNRDLSPEESTCLDRCVNKFSSVNARVMSSYVEMQTEINTRRMKEMETQMQVARDAELTAAAAAATAAATTLTTVAPETIGITADATEPGPA